MPSCHQLSQRFQRLILRTKLEAGIDGSLQPWAIGLANPVALGAIERTKASLKELADQRDALSLTTVNLAILAAFVNVVLTK